MGKGLHEGRCVMDKTCTDCGYLLDDDGLCYECDTKDCVGNLVQLLGRDKMAKEKYDPVEKPIGLPKKRRVSPKIDPSQLELF